MIKCNKNTISVEGMEKVVMTELYVIIMSLNKQLSRLHGEKIAKLLLTIVFEDAIGTDNDFFENNMKCISNLEEDCEDKESDEKSDDFEKDIDEVFELLEKISLKRKKGNK